jgi:SAM-dependent methyltransferase
MDINSSDILDLERTGGCVLARMPTTRDRLRGAVIRQFHRPTGAAGHVVGWIMAHRKSNVLRNRWAAGLLNLAPDSRVLELGCGPGIALAAMAERVGQGLVVGVDHSPVMISLARRRNATAVAAGRVRLLCASVEDLLATLAGNLSRREPPLDQPFDAVLAVNSFGFWSEPDTCLAGIQSLLRPDGQIALVAQPRCPGATASTSQSAANELIEQLKRAGFTRIDSAMLDLDPPVACVLGIKLAGQPGRTGELSGEETAP